MIDWIHRRDPDRPFLLTGSGDWSYGEAAAEVRRRAAGEVRLLSPGLDPDSALEVLAAIGGRGAMVAGPGLDAPSEADIGDAALVVFTSGTTGGPKGVRLTWANLEAAARSSVEHLGHGEDDVWLLAMPLTHVGGLSILVRSAYAGGAVRMLPGPDAAGIAQAMSQDVTMVSLVPTVLRRLLDHHPGPYHGLRAVLVGGGPIPEGLLDRAAAAGLPVLPTYGMTETFGQVATLRPGAPLGRRAHPLPGVGIRIEDDGRIAVRGPQVSPGYLGQPDRASEWLVTGDLGVIDDDGALTVLGRSDTVIVTGGENVDPVTVEAVLMECPAVRGVVVVGVPDETWGAVVACVYEGDADPAMMRAWARDRLPAHMVPKSYRRVPALPRTPLGKPDRSAAAGLFDGVDGAH